ncbi:Polyubiquitin [Thalictrum thalictroides]|uniref:Polyubiquitin n=1 Tax=Thalictrum thalictroides TaxID=46969 RepID=A0A7J6W865_THATH|nr:Polyubiquitin [Thalictrum thalictroides]
MSQLGKTITLDVDIRDTVHTVKGKIQNKEGLSTSRLDLIYLGEELNDCQFLATYKIQERSTLYAVFQVGGAIQVIVSLEQGKRVINLKVKNWYSVENVKNMIESIEGIPIKKQNLYLTGVKLENCMTLADLNIPQGQKLDLICGMRIIIETLTMKTYTLEVDSSDLIEDVKEMIKERLGMPTEQQKLLYVGSQIENNHVGSQLENNHALAYYKIREGDTLRLYICLCGC